MCALVVRLPFDCNARRLGHLEDAGAHFGRDSRIPRGLNIRLAGGPPTVVRAESTGDCREVRARRPRKCHSVANCRRSPQLLPDGGRAVAVRFWPGALFFSEAS